MESNYEKALRLMTDVSKNLADLNDLFKSVTQEELSDEQKTTLQLALLKLTVVVKEFGK